MEQKLEQDVPVKIQYVTVTDVIDTNVKPSIKVVIIPGTQIMVDTQLRPYKASN